MASVVLARSGAASSQCVLLWGELALDEEVGGWFEGQKRALLTSGIGSCVLDDVQTQRQRCLLS